tara:strand:- start:4406 stop:4726 length:321 start_codon:yes stop_codon:yes gene_type:complete
MDVKTINSANARKNFSDLLNESGFGGHRIVVTRKGKAVAALVPIEDLETIQDMEDQMDGEEANRILSDPNSEFVPWESLKRSTELFTEDFLEERNQPDVSGDSCNE